MFALWQLAAVGRWHTFKLHSDLFLSCVQPTNYLHLQVAHLTREPSSALGSDRPDNELSVPSRSSHLGHLTARSPLVRVHPRNRVLVHSEQQPIGADGSSSAGGRGLRAWHGRAGLASRVGLLESVERLVVKSSDTAGGPRARRGRGERSRAGSGGVVERVREGPAGLVAGVDNRLAVVTRSDEAVLRDERQGQVGQGRETNGDMRSGGLARRRGVDDADRRVVR